MIGTYYRLSLADEDVDERKIESNSIVNQRMAVMDFIKKDKDLSTELVHEYVDDGYTGTNMKRPAFELLMQDVRSGKITIIVVKDLSRFSRNYIEIGDYIERIFPFMGVRFIAINDFYDSDSHVIGSTQDMELVVKNIINTSYSRDMSAKIAATNRTKRSQNLYLGGYRPFGFLPDPEDCHKLILDPVASKYVRVIFELAMEGKGTRLISQILNEREIPTPGSYLAQQKQVKGNQRCWNLDGALWTRDKVSHILKNEKYKGTFVAKKILYPEPCGKARLVNDPDQVIKVEDSHVGIVTPEEYEQAQKIFKTTSTERQHRTARQYPLKGKVVCGFCGRKMQHYSRVKTGEIFLCGYSLGLPDSPCTGEPVSGEMLEKVVWNSFSQYRMVFAAAVQKLEQLEEQRLRYKISLENERDRLSDDRTELSKEKAGCYERYAMGELDKDTFLLEKKTFEEKDTQIKDRLEEIRSDLQTLASGTKPIHQQMKERAAMDVGQEISTEFAEEFLENIQVFNNDRVEIHWKYTDEIEQILSMDKGDECFGG